MVFYMVKSVSVKILVVKKSLKTGSKQSDMLMNITNLSQSQQKKLEVTRNKINCIVVLNVT